MLEAHNVPELSAGVNCTFEDLAEMNGLVEGNRIKCSSPAEKEMPRIIVDKGKKHGYWCRFAQEMHCSLKYNVVTALIFHFMFAL